MKLQGLTRYLKEYYEASIFDEARLAGSPYECHLHGRRIVKATIKESSVYTLRLAISGEGEVELNKTDIKLLYPASKTQAVQPLIKIDKKVKAMGLEPIVSLKDRNFVKNKSLFPLMIEKNVVFFTLLEGEIIRGLITGFTKYDITVNLKGGIPVTILRHSIHGLRDKTGRSFLKLFQNEARDWQKSPLFA